jgi:hypothetical protein
MALITPAQIIAAISTRNIDTGHILPAEIAIAERDYISNSIGATLYAAIVADPTTYTAFISDYITPVLAYGTLSNVWQRMGVEVTDRGVNRFTGDGIQSAQEVDKSATLFEIRQRLSSALGAMIDRAALIYPTLYEDTDYKYKEINYYSAQRKRNNAI